jgi:hypothetical protein
MVYDERPHLCQASLNALPHSRQDDSKRDVISPQKGHILCEVKSPSLGFNLIHFLSDADKWARIMRARMTIECKM